MIFAKNSLGNVYQRANSGLSALTLVLGSVQNLEPKVFPRGTGWHSRLTFLGVLAALESLVCAKPLRLGNTFAHALVLFFGEDFSFSKCPGIWIISVNWVFNIHLTIRHSILSETVALSCTKRLSYIGTYRVRTPQIYLSLKWNIIEIVSNAPKAYHHHFPQALIPVRL